MQVLKCDEVVRAVGGALVSGSPDACFNGVSIDSRKINPGDLFVPIVGQKFDAHDFISDCFERGAEGSFIQKDIKPYNGKVLIRVDDTVKALDDLAVYYKNKFSLPFVAVTGSVGKTSTKDMIAAALGSKLSVLKTEGNFNTQIGLPLTLFRLDEGHQAGVVEMGMRGLGEISLLTSIVKPDVAVITNIGITHIELLKSKQNILKAKMEILEGLNPKGLVVLNGDDSLLYGMKGLLSFRTVFYGLEEGMDFRAVNIRSLGENGIRFELLHNNKTYQLSIPVPGIHNVYNAMAAFAVGLELGLAPSDIIEGISAFVPGQMRLNIMNCGSLKIIDDCYNANPQSMEAAINVLHDIGGQRTVAILGDMLELGEWSAKAHFDVGRHAGEKKISCVIAVGQYAGQVALGAFEEGADASNVFSFENNSEASEFLKTFVKPGDSILVKGSRGMKMEQFVEQLVRLSGQC